MQDLFAPLFMQKECVMKRKIKITIIGLVFVIGLAITLYPAISNVYHSYKQSIAISQYDASIAQLENEQLQQQRQLAQTYNERLTGNVQITDPFDVTNFYDMDTEYRNALRIDDSGIMGSLSIPKIGVHLPIYHGTSEQVLKQGVGHLEHTSLPIGGTATHTILSAHTGLPTAKLFNDLDQLVMNDVFYLHVLDDELAYKVIDIQIVKPTETHALKIDFSQDMVTLVTCTPYGINSHRLLVRGVRSQHTKSETSSQQLFMPKNWFETYAGALVVGVIGISFLLGVSYIRKKRKKDSS